MNNILTLIAAAFALLTDMDFRANDDGTFTILDIPMKGVSDPIADVRDLAFFAGQFLAQDGLAPELREQLRAASRGGKAELSARPQSSGFPVFDNIGNQIG